MKKILVVEDEALVRENIVELLQAEGYQTVEARDGEEALNVLWEEQPDLVLCDIRMPRLDGFGVLSRVSQDPLTSAVPFIFLTARTERADMRAGMAMGADDYITKPYTRSDILDAVKKRLEKREVLERQTRKKLEELRESIAYSLPFELLTPLSVIMGHSELLTNQTGANLDEGQRIGVAREIRSASYRLLRLIQDYLYFTDLEVIIAREELRKQMTENRIDAAQGVIREIASAVAGEYQRVQDLNCLVDESQLKIAEDSLIRIIEKLLESAFQQSSPGSPVELKASVVEGLGEYHIQVKDSGRGLSSEQVERIMGKSGEHTKFYGIQDGGIGLMIVRRLVNLYGGRFSLESRPRSGKTVDVYLLTGR